MKPNIEFPRFLSTKTTDLILSGRIWVAHSIYRIYLLYILGIYWVYHGHIFGILGYIMKIGFQYISYHLVHLMSIISIFTIMSLPNTTRKFLKLSNVCKGMGINWDLNLRNGCFCLQRTLAKIWVASYHRLIFTVFWYHALGAHSKSGYLVFHPP